MAKKKKMTKAQAAAARKDMTREIELRNRSREKAEEIRLNQKRMQLEAKKNWGARLVVPIIVFVIIIVGALVFTIAPSAFLHN